jgi:hypothetical protein
MPFTLIHGLIGYLSAVPFTKNPRIRLLAFGAGMLADLDGLPLLFDHALYLSTHHELFHSPIWGLLFGLLIVTTVYAYYTYRKKTLPYWKSLGLFFMAFTLHPLTDALSSDWPMNFLAPIGQFYVSNISLGIPDAPIGLPSNLFVYTFNDLWITIATIAILIAYWSKHRPSMHLSHYFLK